MARHIPSPRSVRERTQRVIYRDVQAAWRATAHLPLEDRARLLERYLETAIRRLEAH